MSNRNRNVWLVQLVEDFGTDEKSAAEALACLTEQDGFRGGRLLPASPVRPTWRVQAFFDDTDCAADGAGLPDGLRRVIVPNLDALLGRESR